MRRSWLQVGARMVLLATLVMVGGCASLRRPPPAQDLSLDVQLRAAVEARLAAEPVLQERRLRVEVRDRAVSLYGRVRGLGELKCALANAALVAGVRTVVDRMDLERGPRDVACVAPRDEVQGSMDPLPPAP